jgi:hypothetical protein
LWWRLPKRQVERLAPTIQDPKARADVEDNFRKTVTQALGGAAVLIGAGSALFQFLDQQRAAQKQQEVAQSQFLQQQKAAHDLLISNQVSKGFEQLAGEKIEMRLGGIYALEGVMNDKTSSQYYRPVLEALCAFVVEKTKERTLPEKPATDVQAALTVIGRRTEGPGGVDLADVSIPGANLINKANLSKAELSRANLSGADLSEADLSKAYLSEAKLSKAKLNQADLSGAYLSEANLSGANLSEANLSEANLSRADLSSAFLPGADLNHAFLRG